jgi:hypothetical protein
MRVLVTTCLLSIVICGVGRASEPGADESITRGLELRRQAKPEQALEMFQRAHALAPSPRTLGQMGLVEASLEHWLDAETHLAASLAMPDDAWVRKNRTFLDQALKVCQRHVGELVITGPGGTDVAVDGKHVGTLPAVPPVKLVQGNAVVTANGAGFKDFSKTVVIEGGAKTSMAIVLDRDEKRPAVALAAPVPLPASSPPLASATEHGARTRTTVTGTGLVAAGAGLLAWGIIWIAVDNNDDCPTTGAACNKVYDTRTGGWIMAAGGAAAAAVGTGLLIWSHHRGESPNVAFGATPTSLLLRARF